LSGLGAVDVFERLELELSSAAGGVVEVSTLVEA
jgi:hypothetical protein